MGIKHRLLNEFVTVRVPRTLLKQVQALSEKEHKTTSAVIREAIVDRLSDGRDSKGQS